MSNDVYGEKPSANPYPFAIQLSGSAIVVLQGLFIEGPLWDGDVPSKSGRDELVNFGLAMRYEGWQQLTKKGLEMALSGQLDRIKERYFRERHLSRNLFHAVDAVMNPPDLCKGTDSAIDKKQ